MNIEQDDYAGLPREPDHWNMSKLRKINQGIDEVAATLEDVRDVPLSILRDLDMRVAEMLPELGKMVAKVEEGMKDPDKARLSRRTALAPALA